MTTLIKTQCPSCEAYFSLPRAQFNELNAKARCGQCQYVFLVNKHIVAADNIHSSVINNKTATKSHSVNDIQHSSEDNFLIYDDMPIEDIQDSRTSFDETDAWVSLSKVSTKSVGRNSPIQKEPQRHAIEKTEYVHDSNKAIKTNVTIVKPNPTTLSKTMEKTSEFAVSSSAANNIHANVDTTGEHKSGYNDNENAWLEKMLEDQDSSAEVVNANSNLSNLLTSMGIPINDRSPLSQKLASDAQERLYPVQTRAQTSAASLLWAIGCLVLIMLLFAQYVIFNLDTLVKNPAYATRLQSVCSLAACSLPSADIDAFNIDNLQHRPSQIKAASTFSDVKAALMNQTKQSQLFPSLKVSIYGSDALIGEFIASPEEYLSGPEKLLFAEQSKLFMFTVPIANTQISRITIDPIY